MTSSPTPPSPPPCSPGGPGARRPAVGTTSKMILPSLVAFLAPGTALASVAVVPQANYVIKTDHYILTNNLFDDNCPMTYDPSIVDDVGAAFSVTYTDPNPAPGAYGMDAYVSGTVGGKKSGGVWRPGSKALTGMPTKIQDLTYDFRIKWKVSQQDAWDDDDKWWATINVIFDYGTEESEPLPEERLFDIVIELDRYEQDDLEDVSSVEKDTYWWFARNDDADRTLKPFVLHIDGADYEWGIRYKFFQNQNWKDDKVHVKFIPLDNNHVAPYIDHPLRVFTEAATTYLQYVNLPPLERTKADLRVSAPDLWVKAIAAGYETYTGSSILRQDELRTISDSVPPAAISSGLTASHAADADGSSGPIDLDWPDHATEASLHGYSLYRSDDNGASYSNIASDLTESSYVDTDVASSTATHSYQYYVTASDRSYNESPPSEIVVVAALLSSHRFNVIEDTFAKQPSPSVNFATQAYLEIRQQGASNYARIPYLKFDVSGLTDLVGGKEEVKSAVLHVYSETEVDAVDALAVVDGADVDAAATSTTWSDETLTWVVRPPTGAVVGTGQPSGPATWFTIDVTGYVTVNGVYSIALNEQGDTVGKLGSLEGGHGAYLQLTTGPTPPPTLHPTPSPTLLPTSAPSAHPIVAPTSNPTSSPTPRLNSLTFDVSDDAFAMQNNPTVNTGSWTKLQVRADDASSSYSRAAYLKFQVQGVQRYVKSAKLFLYALTETDDVRALAVADSGTWTEDGLTWAGRPTTGAVIGTGKAAAAATWFSIDVTSYITGDGVHSIALDEAGGSYGELGSREGGYGAYLELLAGPSDPPTPVPSPAPTVSPTSTLNSISFDVEEDTHAKQPSPDLNFASWGFLEVRKDGDDASSYSRVAYLKFRVEGVSRFVKSATLRVYSIDETDVVNALAVVADDDSTAASSWSESSVTWNNRPPTGAVIGSGQAAVAESWFSIDVTSYITGDGVYSIALDERGNGFSKLGSREGGFGATLDIVAGPSDSPTFAPTNPPTFAPTNLPTSSPTPAPVNVPTLSPTPLYHTVGIWANADTFVMQNNPSMNTGSWQKLQVRSDDDTSNYSRVAYLKFDIAGISRVVASATLHLYALTETDDVRALTVADNDWTEGGLNWGNRPATGDVIGTGRAASSGAAGSWFEIDITDYVVGNGVYTVALDETGGSYGELGSREGGYGAYIEIVTGPAGPVERRTSLLRRHGTHGT